MPKKRTKGQEKIQLLFERLIENDNFKAEVRRIRRALGLPKNGIAPTEKDLKNLTNHYWLPEKLYSNSTDLTKPHFIPDHIYGHEKEKEQYDLEVRKLIKSLPVISASLSTLLRGIIFYGDFYFAKLKNIEKFFYGADVCEIEDAQTEFERYSLGDDLDSANIRGHTDKLEENIYKYPVVLRIHAEAGQRDIVEFIKANWGLIETYKKPYTNPEKKISIRNSKTKLKNKERNDFIYRKRNLPHRKIMSLVNDKYGKIIDYAHIAKIISLEKKRRKA